MYQEKMMESFLWGPNYETDLQDVDRQHRRLVDMINAMGRELAANNVCEQHVEGLLQDLVAYTQYHFTTEENLMAEWGVERRHIELHRTEHQGFCEDVVSMSRYRKAKDCEDGGSLLEFLIHWLAYHILGSDMNMARQVKAIRAGASSTAAYVAGEKVLSESTEPLVTALGKLFQQVSRHNRELALLNQNLERIVEERTRELVKANADLEVLALTDVLTELPNRRHAMRQLQALWREAEAFHGVLACMLIDADGFKAINDSFGHDAGDAVLYRLAQELNDSVRSDDVVCRLGGDEFLIICPNTPLEGALHIAELTRANIAALQVPAGEGFWQGSISVGVASNSVGITSMDDLLKAADDGVYLAKRDGRNCVRSSQV